VCVAHGSLHKGVEGDFGWARIRFSLSSVLMGDALERIESFLALAEGAVGDVMGG